MPTGERGWSSGQRHKAGSCSLPRLRINIQGKRHNHLRERKWAEGCCRAARCAAVHAASQGEARKTGHSCWAGSKKLSSL